jgi:hypothetical protein
MAETASGSSNTYAGGINFSSSQGGGTPTISFDLPLATIGAMQNSAFSFLTANSDANKKFVSTSLAQTGAKVAGVTGSAFDFLNKGLSSILANNVTTGQTLSALDAQAQYYGAYRANVVQQTKQPKSGGGCFITTAICQAENKADDCEELQALRKFRDEVMMRHPVLSNLVREYYAIAPAIVVGLEKLGQGGKEVLHMLRMQYLDNVIAAVRAGDVDEAVGEYVQMVAVARQAAGV